MTEFVKKVQNDELKSSTVSIREIYKATAKVGEDVIEAEYFIFDRSNWWSTKQPKTFKDKLEDLWDTITWPFCKLKLWLRDIRWKIYYGLQRMFKGYDSVDTFETFYKFIERYTKILTEYRKHHWGYCSEMTTEEWDNVIDEMIYHLKYMDEETVAEELERDVPDGWNASHKTICEVLDKHKDRFFELFSKYFYCLWD